MSADNYIGVWFDGKLWRVDTNLSASEEITSREQLERMFSDSHGSHAFQSRAAAFTYAHDQQRECETEYGVREIETPGAKIEDCGVKSCPLAGIIEHGHIEPYRLHDADPSTDVVVRLERTASTVEGFKCGPCGECDRSFRCFDEGLAACIRKAGSEAWAANEAWKRAREPERKKPALFDRELEVHRRQLEEAKRAVNHMPRNFGKDFVPWTAPGINVRGCLEDMCEMLFFLLAVVHQPVPNDYVPVKAVEERLEKLEKAHAASDHADDVMLSEHAARLDRLERMLPTGRIERTRKIVCLCGSTRFSKAFADANLAETLKGNIVLTVGSMTHSDAELEFCVSCRRQRGTPPCRPMGPAHKEFKPLTAPEHVETKKMLDALHLDKIALADEVYVLNQGGYIGDSTRNEIEHAKTDVERHDRHTLRSRSRPNRGGHAPRARCFGARGMPRRARSLLPRWRQEVRALRCGALMSDGLSDAHRAEEDFLEDAEECFGGLSDDELRARGQIIDKAALEAKIALNEAQKKHWELSLERDQIFAILVKRMRKTT